MDNEILCKKISKLDSKMRFVGLINSKGRLIAGGMKKGLKPMQSDKKTEMLYMEVALRVTMRHEFDDDFGAVKFSLSYREKLTIMSFPIDDHFLFVSAERGIDFGNVTFEILNLIEKK